jgi:RNA polymerase sigma-70 factor (ECF subfamily)
MDVRILSRAVKGDREAFGEIVDFYYKDAYLFALSITGNPHDAKDVCQDSFVKAYRNLKKLRDKDSFKSWLMKIVSNTSKDVFKGRKTQEIQPNELYEDFEADSLHDRIDLLDALEKIKPEYRQVLTLRYLNDLKIQDVAKILKLPENTVKSRIRYALTQAKEAMEGER